MTALRLRVLTAMKAKHRRQLELQAARAIALASEARDDARVDARLALGSSAKRYDGSTPTFIDGRATFSPRVLQTRMSAQAGTTRRAGRKGGLKFVPARHDADAPKHGGARMEPGQWLVDDAGRAVDKAGRRMAAGPAYVARTAYVEHEAAWNPETTPTVRDALRRGAGRAVTVVEGKDMSLRDTDPGDDERTVAAAAYWTRIHAGGAQ